LATSDPPTISPGNGPANPEPAGIRTPTREDLERADLRYLIRGEKDKADLFLTDLGYGPIVIKDFRAKAWWVRWLGRLQIARETRAYRWLGSLAGLPRLIGRIDSHALALEKVDARTLGYAPDRTRNGAKKLHGLRRIIDRMQERGLVHCDLRARENVLVNDRDEVFVLDLAGALWLRPGGFAHRLLFPRLRLIDESAYLKWKTILDAGPYTPDEEAFLQRHRFWRSLWIFNPSGRKGPN
jgi:hypothetical protein